MPQLCPLPNCQKNSWDPNVFHANYVLVKIVKFLRLKTFFKSINCVPFKIIKFCGSIFIFNFIFHFGSCALLQCFFLVGIKNASLPINKFIGINMALGRSWINYLYTHHEMMMDDAKIMRWSPLQLWRHLDKYSLEAPYCLFSKQTLAFFTHRGGIIQTLWWPEKWNPKPFVIDKGYMLDNKNYSETFFFGEIT
jgi:hypothetical protein